MGQATITEVALELAPHGPEPLAELDHPLELHGVADGPPPVVIPVLPAILVVAARR